MYNVCSSLTSRYRCQVLYVKLTPQCKIAYEIQQIVLRLTLQDGRGPKWIHVRTGLIDVIHHIDTGEWSSTYGLQVHKRIFKKETSEILLTSSLALIKAKLPYVDITGESKCTVRKTLILMTKKTGFLLTV